MEASRRYTEITTKNRSNFYLEANGNLKLTTEANYFNGIDGAKYFDRKRTSYYWANGKIREYYNKRNENNNLSRIIIAELFRYYSRKRKPKYTYNGVD